MSRSSLPLAPVALAVFALMAANSACAQGVERSTAANTDKPTSTTVTTTNLPPVTVRAQQDRASTEGTERYNSTQATVGKAAAELREIPQSISVVTQQRMEDQNMRNVEEVLEQTVGYVSERFDSESASYASRGFAINNYMIDGVPAPGTAAAWD